MSSGKQIIFWILIFMSIFLGASVLTDKEAPKDLQLTYSQFFDAVTHSKISEVRMKDLSITEGRLKDGKTFSTYVPYDVALIHDLLKQKDVSVISTPNDGGQKTSFGRSVLPWGIALLPILLLIFL